MNRRDRVFELIARERKRQEETLALIPSENFASAAVRKAVGSVMMNKYSEGQIGKRYYQGNAVIDEVEALCKERALRAFGLKAAEWVVNVQVLSGTPANLAVYFALLKPGQKIMAMFLPDGGHLSHGWQYGDNKITLVSNVWDVSFYKVDRTTRVFDYGEIYKQAQRVRPQLLISGGTAYPREIDHKKMGEIARSVRAYYMADIAHEAGLVAAGVNSSPFAYADVVTMTTHKTLRGPRGGMVFSHKELGGLIDRAVLPGLQGGPHNETIAGIAVALGEVMRPEFKDYAQQVVVNAQVLAEELMSEGFDVVSGGTDKHLVLIDLRNHKISGWVAAWALEAAGIVVNRNTVPYETSSPYYPSGLRLGTPFVTTRGMKEVEMKQITGWMVEILEHSKRWSLPDDPKARKGFIDQFMEEIETDKKLKKICKEVKQLCLRFPLE